ncbi:MAG TPA: hypothetical protein VMC43_00810 [Candidatus Paceibacterota bacterium]|nr:hypothetical protein [Candidatus Paceibacterota bacterium]
MAKKYFDKYNQYLRNAAKNINDWSVQENKHRIIEIFKRAGLKDNNLPVIEPGGYGYLNTFSVSFFDNIPMIDKKTPSLVIQFFKESIGVFKSRIFDSVNPIYWLETAVFLPRKIFSYLGVGADSLFVKILQVFWWLASATSIIIGIVFNTEFRIWLSAHFRNF